MATVGRWLAGHSLFISGQPKSFSPVLAKHFLITETLLLPANVALCAVHYVSALSGHAERRALMHDQLQEVNARTEAMVFWTQHFTCRRDEVPNVGFRIAALVLQVAIAPFWAFVAAWSPSTVHQCLASATDLLQQKYVATASGAPHQFYTPHIERLTKCKNDHKANENISADVPAGLFLTLFLFMHMRV